MMMHVIRSNNLVQIMVDNSSPKGKMFYTNIDKNTQ